MPNMADSRGTCENLFGRTRDDKPPDDKLAFCGWAWAEAVRQGDADVWEGSDADLFPKCSSCQKAAFSA